MKYRSCFFLISLLLLTLVPLPSHAAYQYGNEGFITFESPDGAFFAYDTWWDDYVSTQPLGKWDFPSFSGINVNDYGVPDGGALLSLGQGDTSGNNTWNGIYGWNGTNALAFSYVDYDCVYSNWERCYGDPRGFYHYDYDYGYGFPILPEKIDIPIPFASSVSLLIGGVNFDDWSVWYAWFCSVYPYDGACMIQGMRPPTKPPVSKNLPPQVVIVAKVTLDHVVTSKTVTLQPKMQKVTLNWSFVNSDGEAVLPIAKIIIRYRNQPNQPYPSDPENSINPYFMLVDDLYFSVMMNRADLSQTSKLGSNFEIPTKFENAAPLREFDLVHFTSLAGTLDGGAVLPATPSSGGNEEDPYYDSWADFKGNTALAFDCNANLKYGGSQLGVSGKPILPERITLPMHPERWINNVCLDYKSRQATNGSYPDAGNQLMLALYGSDYSTPITTRVVTMETYWKYECFFYNDEDMNNEYVHHMEIWPAPSGGGSLGTSKVDISIGNNGGSDACMFEIDNIDFWYYALD